MAARGKRPSRNERMRSLSGKRRRKVIKKMTKKQSSKDFLPEIGTFFAQAFGELSQESNSFFVLKHDLLLKNDTSIKRARQKFNKALYSFILKKINLLPPHERARFLALTYSFMDNLEINFVVLYKKPKTGHEKIRPLEEQTFKIVIEILSESSKTIKEKCLNLFSELPKQERHFHSIGPFSTSSIFRAFSGTLNYLNARLVNSLFEFPTGKLTAKLFRRKREKQIEQIKNLLVERFEELYHTVPKKQRELFLREVLRFAKIFEKSTTKSKSFITDMIEITPETKEAKYLDLISSNLLDAIQRLSIRAKKELRMLHSPRA